MTDHKYFAKETRTWILRCWVLACLLIQTPLFAAELAGTVTAVNGKTVAIDLNPGRAPAGVGDRVEISFTSGQRKFMVGDWRVIRISGSTVYAEEVDAKLPVDTGMQATVFTGTASVAGQAAVPRQATPARNNELYWREGNQGGATNTPAQATRAADPAEELFWLRPGYRPGQAAAPVAQARPTAPQYSPAPVAPANPDAAILSISTREYRRIWTDAGSGAAVDFASFRPVGPAGYYPLGDIAVAGPWRGPRYGAPTTSTLMVREGTIPLAAPVDYRQVWSSKGSIANQPFSTWEPVPPAGYQCLGDVGIDSMDAKPSLDAIRCIPDSCVVQTGIGQKIWDDTGSGATRDFSAWRVPELNLYIGIASHSRPRSSVYTISPECL